MASLRKYCKWIYCVSETTTLTQQTETAPSIDSMSYEIKMLLSISFWMDRRGVHSGVKQPWWVAKWIILRSPFLGTGLIDALLGVGRVSSCKSLFIVIKLNTAYHFTPTTALWGRPELQMRERGWKSVACLKHFCFKLYIPVWNVWNLGFHILILTPIDSRSRKTYFSKCLGTNFSFGLGLCHR